MHAEHNVKAASVLTEQEQEKLAYLLKKLGHIHGDSLLDIPFPMKVRDELVTARRVEPHHVLPKSGWISFH
ncbi:MAG: luciferase family protein, partial [Bacteroidota bacterium]